MGILANIFGKIFPSARANTEQPPAQPSSQPAASAAPVSPNAAGTATAPGATPSQAAPVNAPAAQPAQPVDVEAVLNGMAANNPQKLNWRTSIVDLLKLLDLDSSLAARKELAQELQYKGDTSDSAAMNIWLHKQVMNKLAANGGKVPADLKD